MALRSYQQFIQLNTLYEVVQADTGSGSSLQPYIEIVGGVGNVYGSAVLPGSPPTNMTNSTPNGLQGIENFGVLPNYLYVTQASGTITSIVLSGVIAKAVS